ncbi:MAG TPA: hypothetical protein VKW06_03215 [Candidatus Angelobacter sp.]|nr:hypothetical protein [Candidatus Angelobacter sp.]
MADSEQQPFSAGTQPPEPRNWTPILAGAGLVMVIVAVVALFSRMGQPTAKPGDPYLDKVQLSNLHMATAQNFAGTSVTYIEGTINNIGDRKLTDATVEVLFKNSLGETSLKESSLPVTVALSNTPYPDFGTLEHAPLAAGKSRDFRLTIEYVTPDWDGQLPQVKVVSVKY